jgi:hypothetical protein
MKKINFHQLKFILPAITFFPLLGLGWLVIDIFHTERQSVECRSALPAAKPTDKFWSTVEWNDTIIADSIEYDSWYSEIKDPIQELQHLADSLKESEGKVIPEKKTEWRQWNTLDGCFSNVKTGIKKTAFFFFDIIDHGAVPVYIKTDTPADSIN